MSNTKKNAQGRVPTGRIGFARLGMVYVLAVVLLGFAMAGSLQHCCRALAGGLGEAIQLADVTPRLAGEPVYNHDGQGDDNDQCPQLTSVDAVAPVELLLPGSPSVYAVVASYITTKLATLGSVPSTNTYPPLPPWRLYLSTQRLRI
jgi:hypothetical protein